MVALLKPVVSWPGGKTRMLKHLRGLVPEHEVYCEPFAGGLAMLLDKQPSGLEIINDLDGELINFYRVVRHHYAALCEYLDFVPFARQEFFRAREEHCFTDIQWAADFLIRNKLSFAGLGENWYGFCLRGIPPSRSNRLAAIHALNARLDQVVIENRPALEIIAGYDSAGTFFFCDPPYIVGDAKRYKSWTPDDMKTLADAIRRCKAKVLLTVCDCEACRDIFSFMKLKFFKRQNGIGNRGRVGLIREYAELFSTNYPDP